MCVCARREYQSGSLDPERAARFASAALLNVLPPTDWQISADVEVVVARFTEALRQRETSVTASVEVCVHNTNVEIVVSCDDPEWVEERVRLFPRRPFATAFDCDLPGEPAEWLPRPALWPSMEGPRTEASREQWNATWDALHEITQSIRVGGEDPTPTLDAVAAGVVKATTFTVAAVNLAQDDGTFRVVSVHGSAGAREALLDVVEPASAWLALIDGGAGWGSLRFHRHDIQVMEASDMVGWVDSEESPGDFDQWNPQDMLIAPLRALDGTLLGVLSVDLPAGSLNPGVADLERLEVFADHAAAAIERARNHIRLAT